MHRKLLEILACPGCAGSLSCAASGDKIVEGELRCTGCAAVYPVRRSIPRFVPAENYAASFGYQWNRFRQEQLDSANKTRLSEDRFYSETGWTPEWMAGKWLLEAGCGAGRFLEVASRSGAQVVGLDLSNAVDAVRDTLGDRPNLHLVQASIFALPFRREAFEGVYSIGVLQHTPDPRKALEALPGVVKPGGRLAVTVYERRRWTKLYSKYWLRPVTSRMNPRWLLFLIRLGMPLMFPLTEVLFRIPGLKRFFQFVIPVANYVDNRELGWKQRYRWAILDTFDMLAPRYDLPQTQADLEAALRASGMSAISRLPNPGLNLVAEKPAARVEH